MLSGLVIRSWSVFCLVSSEISRMVRMGTRKRKMKVRLLSTPVKVGLPDSRLEMAKNTPAMRMKNPTKTKPMGETKYALSSRLNTASMSGYLPFFCDQVEEYLLEGEIH